VSDQEKPSSVWDEVDAFLEEHADRFKMSFGLEYSCVVDWCADFTPRRGHPQAREYGLWTGSSTNRDEAIRRAMARAREAIEEL